MSNIFSSLLGTGGIGSLLGPIASLAQPAPSQASRGTDFNPVTNINAVGAPDFAGINQILQTIGQGNSQNAALVFPSPVAQTYTATGGSSFNPLILYGGIALVLIIIWRKSGR